MQWCPAIFVLAGQSSRQCSDCKMVNTWLKFDLELKIDLEALVHVSETQQRGTRSNAVC